MQVNSNISEATINSIVITGTSRGLGYELAKHFLNKGYLVSGCSRGDPTINHQNYTHFSLDLSDETSVRKWSRAVKEKIGFIGTLVCNAGLVELGAVTGATSFKDFKSFHNSIMMSTFLTCREFSKTMMLQKYGRIINISSIMTEIHAEGTCAYASAKSAVNEFSRILAKELIPFNITCNIISPSLINTRSSKAFGDEWKDNMLGLQSIKKAIDPYEIAHIIEFFSSPQSANITGQNLNTCFIG